MIEIKWIKYDNFFDLWRRHKDGCKLLYVIGDQHHCYIGSIGGSRGKKGLGNRYQWQYLDRARSIFGQEESAGQVAYVGLFQKPAEISGHLIRAAEAFTQNCCRMKLQPQACLFKCKKFVNNVDVSNVGDTPPFLN